MIMTTNTAPRAETDGSTEPVSPGLGLVHELDRSLRLTFDGQELFRYVYEPWDVQLESPRPYFHPLRTLSGDLVSLYRPHDHVWHKGIAWSLPNVGDANFWGGPTYLRDRGYVQLDNDGTTAHRGFETLTCDHDRALIDERLDWVTQQGETWFTERRRMQIAVHADLPAWSLTFETTFTNVSEVTIPIGSPTTQGRDNAGYGGLFWRGPRSFTGGTVHTPDATGGDELMGVRAPWMAFVGKHDDVDRSSTLVFVDAPDNPEHPTQWFVRSDPFACVCPAPFFSEEVPVAPGGSETRRYAVVIADRVAGADGAARLADRGLAALPPSPPTNATGGPA
jgi:hypothetical protein